MWFVRLWWGLTILSSLLGGVILFFGVAMAEGAPQQAAAGAIACALAVIPYVIARALHADYEIKSSRRP